MSDYLIKCRENYFKKITPSNKKSKDTEDYKDLLLIAKNTIDNIGIDKFSEYFQDGYYLVNLWTAHIIIEYYNPSKELEKKCLEIIKDHLDNPLAPLVAVEEKTWLEDNIDKY
ncbi:MAG: hypothetical protein U0T69_05345 [Chitinophagales bacterium]